MSEEGGVVVNGSVNERVKWGTETPDETNSQNSPPQLDRYVSDTPSMKELNKWKKQMESVQLMNLSLHQVG